MRKLDRYILYFVSVVFLTACEPLLKRTYKSFNDYPVPSGDLTEMEYSSKSTTFSFWSPNADEVRLMLFRTGDTGHAYRTVHMQPGMSGVWTAVVEGNLLNQYYTFNVKLKDKWQGDTPGLNAHAVGVNGKRAAIIDMETTNPRGWDADKSPSFSSPSTAVVYNLHYHDFSADSTSGIRARGKYLALTERGTHNSYGMSTGVDHLKDMGITHVQLMPSFDFSDIDESDRRHVHYNYGCNPLNYNVPEGSYAMRADIPSSRIREFKQMVMALHKAGIRVVMEMSFNHVYDKKSSNFERSAPGYFFRKLKGKDADGSGYGNETATERPMMRKFMVESVRYWINEYHVDGFYFDMMGLTDLQTMRAIRAAVDEIDPSILIYGDATSPNPAAVSPDSLAITANTYRMPGVGAYSHELCNALLGKKAKAAFLGGLPGDEETIRFATGGAIANSQIKFYRVHDCKRAWAAQPSQQISYLTDHNGYTLVDHLRATLPGVTPEQQLRLSEVAQTAVMCSQGIPVIYCGDELLRSKNMIHNSMASSDTINRIDWRLKSINNGYFEYIKALIHLRQAHPAFRMGNVNLVRRNLEFLPSDPNVVAYRLKNHAGGDTWGDIVVVLNTCLKYAKVVVPEGLYTVVCNNGKISEEGIGKMMGPEIGVPGQTALIMWK